MTHLADHAHAMRTLGKAMRERAAMSQNEVTRETLDLMGCAHMDAALSIETELREEAKAHAAATRCTLAHTGKPCPACGAKA